MKRRAKAPAWALRLVEEECRRAGARLAPLRWRLSTRKDWVPSAGAILVRQTDSSHGNCNHVTGITLFAGTEIRDARMVLLHELAHWLEPVDSNHGPSFWDRAFEMYKRHRMARYALTREAGYRSEAVKAAARATIISRRQAKAILAAKRTGYSWMLKVAVDKAARR